MLAAFPRFSPGERCEEAFFKAQAGSDERYKSKQRDVTCRTVIEIDRRPISLSIYWMAQSQALSAHLKKMEKNCWRTSGIRNLKGVELQGLGRLVDIALQG